MKKNEDGEWLRMEPRPDLALDEDAEPPVRRKRRPAPGKVTRTLALPASAPGAARVPDEGADAHASSADATQHDPFPDVFGGALDSPKATAPVIPAPAVSGGGGELAAAKAAVDRAWADQRNAILAAAAAQGPSLEHAAAAAHAHLLGDIATREGAIRGTFAQAREALRNTERAQIALARSDAATVARRLHAAAHVRDAYRRAASVEADRVTATIRLDGSMITASADSIYRRLDTARSNALGDANVDLRAGDGEAALEVLDAARDGARKEIQRAVTADWGELLKAGMHSAIALRNSAGQLAEELSAPMDDAGDEVSSAGDMLAAAISHGSQQQLEALANAERELLTSLARLRSHTSTILQAGQIAAMRIRQYAANKVSGLGIHQAAAHRALDTVAPAGPEALGEMRDHAVAAAGDAGQSISGRLHGASSALTAVVGERRTQVVAAIDQQLASLSKDVGPVATRFTGECNMLRTNTLSDYVAAENQLNARALSHLGPATAVWRAEADRFIADAARNTTGVLDMHRRIEAGLDAEFVRIAREAVRLNQRSDMDRALDTAAAGARGLVRGARNFAVGTVKFIAIGMGAGMLGGLGILAAGAYLGFEALKGVKHRVDQARSVWHERGVVGKWLAVEETMRVIVADQLGLTGLVEGILHHEAITHRTLSTEEAAARYSESALQLVAMELLGRFPGKQGAPPAGAKADTIVQPRGETPPKPPPSQLRPPEQPVGPGLSPAQRVGNRVSECFVADTRVSTPSGPRPIQALRAGDKVHALNLDDDKSTITSTVLASASSTAKSVLEIVVGSTTIRCTAAHPFWTPTAGWQPAGALTPGSFVRSSVQGTMVVEAVREVVGEFLVFNMEVSGHHNYLVGDNAILVHNKPQRWTAKDRALDLRDRAEAALQDAQALPEGAHGRAELVERARAIQGEAAALDAKASASTATAESLETHRARIEAVEETLLAIEEGVDVATLASRARSLPHRVRSLMAEAQNLPNSAGEKWGILEELRRAERDAAAVRDLVDAEPASAVELRTEIERVEADLIDLEVSARKASGAPADASRLPRPWLDYPSNHLPVGGSRPYVPPRQAGNPELVRHPEKPGFLDEHGNRWEWARDQHAGPHWDVQHPNGSHTNVYPDGEVHQGGDRFDDR